MTPAPAALAGDAVRLEPLAQSHAQGLYNRGRVQSDWQYLPRSCFVDLADTRQWIDEALKERSQIPFAVVELHKHKVVGSTRFMNIQPEHRSLEVGWTWLGQEWQRTAVNTQIKALMLKHAFERLGCLRVEFKTDARNQRSQRALERIGATKEGVLRSHRVVQGGHVRDSVYYSILASEWPRLKEHLKTLAVR